jgi:DNA-binding CsgD family transcriptional regulator
MTALLEFKEKIQAHKGSDDFWSIVSSDLQKFDISSIFYASFPSHAIRGTEDHRYQEMFFWTNHPQDWIRAVEGKNLLDHDLTSELVIAGADIVDWKDPKIWENAAPEYVAQAKLEQELGLDQGKTLGLSREGDTGVFSGIGLSTPDLNDQELEKLWRAYQEDITRMCFALDQVVHEQRSSLLIGLTPREMDCLTYLAVGLRPSEISFRLKISPKTFEKHITNAKAKLRARTRDHAVAKAVGLRLLNP